jgi:hypothetical protein
MRCKALGRCLPPPDWCMAQAWIGPDPGGALVQLGDGKRCAGIRPPFTSGRLLTVPAARGPARSALNALPPASRRPADTSLCGCASPPGRAMAGVRVRVCGRGPRRDLGGDGHGIARRVAGVAGSQLSAPAACPRARPPPPVFPPPLTEEQILAWAEAHQRRLGVWAMAESGPGTLPAELTLSRLFPTPRIAPTNLFFGGNPCSNERWEKRWSGCAPCDVGQGALVVKTPSANPAMWVEVLMVLYGVCPRSPGRRFFQTGWEQNVEGYGVILGWWACHRVANVVHERRTPTCRIRRGDPTERHGLLRPRGQTVMTRRCWTFAAPNDRLGLRTLTGRFYHLTG